MKKTLVAASLLLALAFLLPSCYFKIEKVSGDTERQTETEAPVTETESETEEEFVVPVPPYTDGVPLGYRSFLEGQQADIYDTMYANIAQGNYTFDLPFDATYDDRQMLMNTEYLFMFDHTEYLDISLPRYNWTRGNGRIRATFDRTFPAGGSDFGGLIGETFDAADEIVAMASELPTDFDKILFVHDYIINNTVYDDSNEDTIYRSTPYACLVEGRCVCSGYAGAFCFVMHRLGINCLYIWGNADNGSEVEMHAWNYVESDGEWYMIDLTWDDTAMPYTSDSEARYDYFCITSEEAAKDHYYVSRYISLPECTAKDLNYHYHNGCYLEEYDFEKVADIFNNGAESVKFASEEEYEKAYEDLFENDAWRRIDAFANADSVTYLGSNRIIAVIGN